MEYLDIEGTRIPYVVDYRNVKYMRLEIKPDGSLLVVMPKETTVKPVDFIIDKKTEFLGNLEKLTAIENLEKENIV